MPPNGEVQSQCDRIDCRLSRHNPNPERERLSELETEHAHTHNLNAQITNDHGREHFGAKLNSRCWMANLGEAMRRVFFRCQEKGVDCSRVFSYVIIGLDALVVLLLS